MGNGGKIESMWVGGGGRHQSHGRLSSGKILGRKIKAGGRGPGGILKSVGEGSELVRSFRKVGRSSMGK